MKTATKTVRGLRVFEIVLMAGMLIFLLSGIFSLRTQEELADKVVRLHVLANSDSEEDQTLKLQVRDVVLDRATDLLEQSADRKEAEGLLRGNLLEFEQLAETEIRNRGYEYPVTVELTDASFPTKEYDGFTLPGGKYLALRVIIGEGGGRNWWCVVFPPLCTAASAQIPVAALSAGFSEDEVQLITEQPGYILRFKSVEWWESIREKWDAGKTG